MKSVSNKVKSVNEPNATDKLIIQSLAKLDETALGISIGVLFGLMIFLATNLLILKGGDVVGPNLALISQYFIGYKVTFVGSLLGFLYAFVSGFIIGWLAAFLRNSAIKLYLQFLKFKNSMSAVNEYFDHL